MVLKSKTPNSVLINIYLFIMQMIKISNIFNLSLTMCDMCLFQLGGIVTPNDGHCHLDSNHEDSESLFQVSI